MRLKKCVEEIMSQKKGGGGGNGIQNLLRNWKSIRNKYFIFLNVVKLMQVSLNGLKGHITIK